MRYHEASDAAFRFLEGVQQMRILEVVAVLVLTFSTTCAVFPRGPRTPADETIDTVQAVIEQTRSDIPDIVVLAEKCAQQLIATQRIGAYPKPELTSYEFMGRAAGFINFTWAAKPEDPGVIIYMPSPACEDLDKVINAKAYVYAICPREFLERGKDPEGRPYDLSKLAGILGGLTPDQVCGPDRSKALSVPISRLGQVIRGWAFLGEVVAACTRQGKMPMIFKSVQLPDSKAWNEPLIANSKKGVMFHDDMTVKPVPAGYIAKTYLDSLSRDIRGLRSEVPAFRKAGQVMAEALADGHRAHVWIFGHAFPGLVRDCGPYELPPYFTSYEKGVKEELQKGDVQVVMPYAKVPMDSLTGTLDTGWTILGARSIPPELAAHTNVITFRIQWAEGDAVVRIKGYPAKLLPDSAVVQATAFFAMAAEAAQSPREN